MIASLFIRPIARARHQEAALLKEREQYLSHLLLQGTSHQRVRSVASILLQVIRLMEIVNPRSVALEEIHNAGAQWAKDGNAHKTRRAGMSSAYAFTNVAKSWFRFHGLLVTVPISVNPFATLLNGFLENAGLSRGLAFGTIRSYRTRVSDFLNWVSGRHHDFSSVSLNDVDDFLDSKRAMGWLPRTIAAQCQALRTFFKYAEIQGWCTAGIGRDIRSPTIPKYDAAPKGLSWKDVRLLLKSTSDGRPTDHRSRAIVFLCAIYALRSSEIARLSLSDLDWRNETLTVRRAKCGRVQQYPLQYEVGEAILRYLQEVRPHCLCRNLFVTRNPPHRPIRGATLWLIVNRRMKRFGIESRPGGPHSLRHACATRLLRQGFSLRDIADFLGHRDTKSVSIYAKHDTRSLRKVAAFSLSGLR
jgi:integrase/recombinase XerD